MQKNKILTLLITFILLINIVSNVYADDEISEEDISIQELQEIKETAVDISDVPAINARNAVCFDRVSRKSIIWKARKCKM